MVSARNHSDTLSYGHTWIVTSSSCSVGRSPHTHGECTDSLRHTQSYGHTWIVTSSSCSVGRSLHTYGECTDSLRHTQSYGHTRIVTSSSCSVGRSPRTYGERGRWSHRIGRQAVAVSLILHQLSICKRTHFELRREG